MCCNEVKQWNDQHCNEKYKKRFDRVICKETEFFEWVFWKAFCAIDNGDDWRPADMDTILTQNEAKELSGGNGGVTKERVKRTPHVRPSKAPSALARLWTPQLRTRRPSG